MKLEMCSIEKKTTSKTVDDDLKTRRRRKKNILFSFFSRSLSRSLGRPFAGASMVSFFICSCSPVILALNAVLSSSYASASIVETKEKRTEEFFCISPLLASYMTSNLCATAVPSDSNRPNFTPHARLSNPFEEKATERRVQSPIAKESSAFEC